MFKKKPNIKPLAPIRSSDRRKLATQIIKDFNLTIPHSADVDVNAEAEAGSERDPSSSNNNNNNTNKTNNNNPAETALRNSLLPENASLAKFTTTAGPDLVTVTGAIYVGTHLDEAGGGGKGELRPLWVKVGEDEMFPTVYTLWKNPTLLPMLHTHQPVLAKLQTGADLMIPGLVGPPFPAAAKKGRLVAIASCDSPTVPLVVGVCEVDVNGLVRVVGEKGKAVRVVHWAGDEIFNFHGAGGKIPEFIQGPTVAVDEVGEVAQDVGGIRLNDEENGGKGKEVEGLDVEGGEEEVRELTAKEIDEAFRSATLYGLHQYSKKKESLSFPLTSSLFISTLVLPFLPPASQFPPYNLLQNNGPHPSLQLKKSSYKNAAKFLKSLQKELLIKTKVRNGGEIVVMDIDWNDQNIKDFTPYKLPEAPKESGLAAASVTTGAGGAETPGSTNTGMRILEFYKPTGRTSKIFEAVKASTRDLYTASEIKAIMSKYTDQESLQNAQNKRLTKIDPLISSTLLSEKTDSEIFKTLHIKRDVLAERLLSSCTPYYHVIHPPSSSSSSAQTKPKPGPPPRIQILLESRQGKKSVTKISGLEAFGVDPKTLAEELQRVCAGSASVGLVSGCSPKNPVMEVVVQGSQSGVVVKALGKKGVEERFCAIVDKCGKKK